MSQCQTIVNSQCDKRNLRSVLSKWLLLATGSSDSPEVARAMPRVLSISLSFGCFTCLLQRPRQTEGESSVVSSRSPMFSFQKQVGPRRLWKQVLSCYPLSTPWSHGVQLWSCSARASSHHPMDPPLRSACPLSPRPHKPPCAHCAPKCNYSHSVRTPGRYRLPTKP